MTKVGNLMYQEINLHSPRRDEQTRWTDASEAEVDQEDGLARWFGTISTTVSARWTWRWTQANTFVDPNKVNLSQQAVLLWFMSIVYDSSEIVLHTNILDLS